MKLKKIPYYLLLLLLTIGASLIIGFLSFTGMFILAPILGLAIGSFILSVAYEGEIYLQNIKGALDKLFKRDFLKNQLANDSLVKQFENNAIDTNAEDCPQFFKDYEAQLKLLHKFGHKRLEQKSQEAKRKIEKTLKDMEKWYAKQLFSNDSDAENSTGYETELGQWLRKSKRAEMRRLHQLHFNQLDEADLLIIDENSTTSAWVNEYLTKQFEKQTINTEAANCPQFFKDYKAQLDQLTDLPPNDVDADLPEAQIQAQAALTGMQRQFASLMLSNEVELQNLTDYERELHTWMDATPHEEANSLYAKRNYTYKWVIAFSAVSGFFMSIGITYLLVEAFALLPILATLSVAALPAIIIPMALVSGVAYTFLIYNAVTDMIHNDTLRKWYYKIRDDFKQGVTPRGVFIAVSAVLLLALTIALTICTAGTWWTVAKNAQPLFSWMSRMPSFIMGVINPIILGASQLIFNLQNTSETLDMIDDATRIEDNFFKKIGKGIAKAFYDVWDNENWLQMLNPFRIILKLTVTPLRLLFFFGHLISIGVTADRVPGMPEIASAILGIISEAFEDGHYFLGDLLHNHHHHHSTKDLLKERFTQGHGHDHSADIPTRIIKFLATPIYAAAAAWDYAASRFVRAPNPCGLIQIDAEAELSFAQLSPSLEGRSAVVLQNDRLFYANHRTDNVKEIKRTEANRNHYESLAANIAGGHRFAVEDELELISSLTGRHGEGKSLSWTEAWDRSTGQPPTESVIIKPTAKKPSNAWQIEQSVQRIDRYLEDHLNQASIYPERAAEKAEGLVNLRRDLTQMENPSEIDIKARLVDEVKNPVYSRQRFFKTGNPTRTEDFLTALPERISAPAA